MFGVVEVVHLWRNNVEKVPSQRVLLGKHVELIRLKGNAEHVNDKRAGRQIQRDAVLPQERLELGRLLFQELQGHFCAFWVAEKCRMVDS